jgi:hypothetical protein
MKLHIYEVIDNLRDAIRDSIKQSFEMAAF